MKQVLSSLKAAIQVATLDCGSVVMVLLFTVSASPFPPFARLTVSKLPSLFQVREALISFDFCLLCRPPTFLHCLHSLLFKQHTLS